MVRNAPAGRSLGRWLYALAFVIVLPLLLASWAIGLGAVILFPLPPWHITGAGIGLLGLAMMLRAIRDLHVYGHGLPMNPYPPERFVTQGLYAWFPHPIYLGAVICSAGVSLWLGSASGLYVVTPVLGLLSMTLVFGYERLAMRKRFGQDVSEPPPVFALPSGGQAGADRTQRVAMLVRVLAPWLLAGYLIDYARCATTCPGSFSGLLDAARWTGWDNLAWILPMLYVLVRIASARTGKELQHVVVAGTLGTALSVYLYLLLPAFGVDPAGSTLVLTLLNFGAFVVGFLHPAIWSGLQRACEAVANSRRDWLFMDGRVRIISHSIYSFGIGAIGAAIASYVTGSPHAVLIGVICGAIGGAVYAQLSWGSGALLRPFGYWGGVLGVILGMLLAYVLFNVPLAAILVTPALAGPFAQLVGRLRCTAQGCCHGVETDERFGIRVWNQQSRVVMLSGLGGHWILITQLYSMLFNLVLGILLWGMWLSRAFPAGMILGMYFVLTGIERFSEDAYRGEKQTRTMHGLREPQWLAMAAILLGAILCVLPSDLPLPAAGGPVPLILITAAVGGALTAFAMSIDFPKSNVRFSRLSG